MAKLDDRSRIYLEEMQRGHAMMPDLVAISALQALAKFLAQRDRELTTNEIAMLVGVGAALIPAAQNHLKIVNQAHEVIMQAGLISSVDSSTAPANR